MYRLFQNLVDADPVVLILLGVVISVIGVNACVLLIDFFLKVYMFVRRIRW